MIKLLIKDDLELRKACRPKKYPIIIPQLACNGIALIALMIAIVIESTSGLPNGLPKKTYERFSSVANPSEAVVP